MLDSSGSINKAMRVIFRTDATPQIGTGHFMRCLTLADELRKADCNVSFICHDLPAHFAAMLSEREISWLPLTGTSSGSASDGLAHSHWLWTDQAHDAEACLQLLSASNWDWVIVDHYALDYRWEACLRKVTRKIMVIDDLADRRHDCDVLLDQNYYLDMNHRYLDKVPDGCQLLLGPRYALLREEFRKLRPHIKPRDGKVRRILVFFGGIDADNYTGLTIQALSQVDIKDIAVDVVIGAQHPFRIAIEQACTEAGFICHVQTTRMAELMADADLAIGAGGSATWERCCLGLPAICVCVADNQHQQIADAAEQGLIYSLSPYGDFIRSLQRHISVILENELLLKMISRIGIREVDGLGIKRIATVLGVNNIQIRTANEFDSIKLFEWRNHPSIRAVSKNTNPIAWHDHQVWFDRVLSDKNKVLLIGEIDKSPIGVVRFDQDGDVALLSIYLVPGVGGKGQGRNLLLSAEKWLKRHRTDIKSIHADVMGNNSASQSLFAGTNYYLKSMHYLKKL